MSDEETDEMNKNENMMSKNYDKPAHLAFINKSEGRRAAIYWLNYKGERVRYAVLDYSEGYFVDTYETHPWVFADADTGDELLGNGCKIYMPKAWNGEQHRTLVSVSLPVYSLKERCLQVVREICKKMDIPKGELPQTLWNKVYSVKSIPFSL